MRSPTQLVVDEAQSLARIFAAGNDEAKEHIAELDPVLFTQFRQTAELLARGAEPAKVLSWLSPAEREAILEKDPAAGDASTPLQVLSADEILAASYPEPPWVVPGILPPGLSFLAGRPKVGKSWLALQIAHAVAAGGVTLGQRVEQGGVLFLALEDPPRRLQQRMRMQHWQPGRAAVDFIVLGQYAEQIGDMARGGGERLAQQIRAKGYRLVVIDTFSRAFRTDQNDVEEVTVALTPMQEMSHACDCAVLLIDHHKKVQSLIDVNDADAVGDILGSTAKGAMADCILGLYQGRGRAGTVLAVRGREVEDTRLALGFHKPTGSWQLEGDADRLRITPSRQEVLDAVRQLGEASADEIGQFVGKENRGNLFKELQDLVHHGYLIKAPGVSRATGRPAYLYSLTGQDGEQGDA